MNAATEMTFPGSGLLASKMPGHWLLARLGKRVLRPGGLEMTRTMLESLNIQSSDDVVEFAPGLGVTAKMTINRHPKSYTAVEEDPSAASRVRQILSGPRQQCVTGTAAETGLSNESATVVYGEAMLSMQGPEQKRRIVSDAHRVLKPGGRYALHELCLVPDDLDETIKQEIKHSLSHAIHVGTRPLTRAEWRRVLEAQGFSIQAEALRPMRLLEPDRLIQDEGFRGALHFGWNLLRDGDARRRVLEMRRVFTKHRTHLAAIMLVGIKQAAHDGTVASTSA
jgi:SAM-dependent methyltransferase